MCELWNECEYDMNLSHLFLKLILLKAAAEQKRLMKESNLSLKAERNRLIKEKKNSFKDEYW